MGISYYLGVDGISLFIILMATLMTLIGMVSMSITKNVKNMIISLLFLEMTMVGVFVALDAIIFYLFWELSLVPMLYLVGAWGGPKRVYAAIKFFLYTLAGSVLMLVAIIALRLDSGTFSIPVLIEMAQNNLLTGERLPGGGELLGMAYHTWVFWFLFVGVLTAEWVLRRRFRLR